MASELRDPIFDEGAALEDVAVAGATSARAGNGGIRPAVIEGGGPLQSPSVVIPLIKLPLLSEGGKSTPAEPILPDGERFDIIYDTIGKVTFGNARNSLTDNGRLLLAVATIPQFFQWFLTSLTPGARVITGVALFKNVGINSGTESRGQ